MKSALIGALVGVLLRDDSFRDIFLYNRGTAHSAGTFLIFAECMLQTFNSTDIIQSKCACRLSISYRHCSLRVFCNRVESKGSPGGPSYFSSRDYLAFVIVRHLYPGFNKLRY